MSLAQIINSRSIDRATAVAMGRIVAEKIRCVATPRHLILFGSAVEGRFTNLSDLDIVVVFDDLETLTAARKAIVGQRPLHPDVPVDLVFLTTERFDAMKNIGGIAYVAHHEGVVL